MILCVSKGFLSLDLYHFVGRRQFTIRLEARRNYSWWSPTTNVPYAAYWRGALPHINRVIASGWLWCLCSRYELRSVYQRVIISQGIHIFSDCPLQRYNCCNLAFPSTGAKLSYLQDEEWLSTNRPGKYIKVQYIFGVGINTLLNALHSHSSMTFRHPSSNRCKSGIINDVLWLAHHRMTHS